LILEKGDKLEKFYSTTDVAKVIQAIDDTTIKNHKRWGIRKPRTKALVHVFASSGIALGSVSELKIKDIKPISNCYSITVHGGTPYEFMTFITPEARIALDEYLQNRGKFTPEESLFEMSYDAMRMCIYRLVKKAKISRVTKHDPSEWDIILDLRKNPRYRLDTPIVQGFRKRWLAAVKLHTNFNSNLINLMLEYSENLDLDYYSLKILKAKMFEEYKKTVNQLTVFKNSFR